LPPFLFPLRTPRCEALNMYVPFTKTSFSNEEWQEFQGKHPDVVMKTAVGFCVLGFLGTTRLATSQPPGQSRPTLPPIASPLASPRPGARPVSEFLSPGQA